MTRAAFYAPMKPPDDPKPSGDRTMARAIAAALSAEGVHVNLVSRFRSRDKAGNADFQSKKYAAALDEITRLTSQGKAENWHVWVTYHNYYKAPDLLGPAVSQALNIPYIIVEASRARKRLAGPWARYAKAAEAASDAADALLYMTRRDAAALEAYRKGGQRLVHFPPFLTCEKLPEETIRDGTILAVGMMRPGDKRQSYQLIADTLSHLGRQDIRLLVAGDGPARSEIETLMAPLDTRVRFLGALTEDAMNDIYRRSSIFFWPGVNEAFGMVYLEAQAAGMTVLAQDRPGVRDILSPGVAYPSPQEGTKAMAARLDLLLANPKLTRHLGRAARRHVGKHHLLDGARQKLASVIHEVRR